MPSNGTRKLQSQSRRPTSTSPTPSPTLSKGATARSSLPRPAPSALSSAAANRRLSAKAGSPTSGLVSKDSSKEETDHREQFLVLIQDKDQTIASLTTENFNLTSALNDAETRVHELYADQSRTEAELAQRIDIAEKLRAQVRELEKEKRDVHRRYNEQTVTFEAERQAFYDNEQHLKSRIQSLTDAYKRRECVPITPELELETEVEDEDEPDELPPRFQAVHEQNTNDHQTEPAEMTSLRLELSTLSTSYSSLQSTLVLLQTQLVDLRRVNRELQEENESYMILLREKTLSGQFDVMAQVGGRTSDEDEEDDEDQGHLSPNNADIRSLRSAARSTLDRVDEELTESLEQELPGEADQHSESTRTRQPSRSSRRRTPSSSSAPRGESLADLPITGPGLDLAAELGRAENKDILEGNIEESDHAVAGTKKYSRADTHGGDHGTLAEVDALRNEVKSLKDANKALTLYASKILDRIISQEGFEHVLAVDYDKVSSATPVPQPIIPKMAEPKETRLRPQSVIVAGSTSSPMPEPRMISPSASTQPQLGLKTQRRSLSFDWKGFSFFGGPEKKSEPSLRPLTLKPGSNAVTGNRKLDNEEDEEDQKERERLKATMKLMGIQPLPNPEVSLTTIPPMPIERSSSMPSTNANRRFSMRPTDGLDTLTFLAGNTDRAALRSESSLTHAALQQVEAENSLAALDAHERVLSEEIARGANSGFTDIAPRRGSKRNRKSGGGSSGSTVWSAGMSGGDVDESLDS